MKKIFLTFAMGALLIHSGLACEVIQKLINAPEEEEGGSHLVPFLKQTDGSEEPLPKHTLYMGVLSNEKKTIWAINFKDASNYKDVDLVLCTSGKPLVLTGLFDRIEPTLVKQKILPPWRWDNQSLVVEKIQGNQLKCHFYGASHAQQQDLQKTFTLLVSHTNTDASFSIKQ